MLILNNTITEKWKLHELDSLIDEINNDLSETIDNLQLDFKQDYKTIVIYTAGKTILTLREIIGLCSLGYPEGALSLSRNIYEQFIILSFFQIKKDTVDFSKYVHDYFVDFDIKQNKAFKYEYENDKDKAEELKLCEDKLKKLKNIIAFQKVNGEYWWAGYPTFSKLVDYVISETKDKYHYFVWTLHYAYKRACFSLHSSLIGNVLNLGTNNDISIIDTLPKLDGFDLPLWFSSSCFIMVTGVLCQELSMDFDKYKERLNNLALFYRSNLPHKKDV